VQSNGMVAAKLCNFQLFIRNCRARIERIRLKRSHKLRRFGLRLLKCYGIVRAMTVGKRLEEGRRETWD
jgi:hypothetical protein